MKGILGYLLKTADRKIRNLAGRQNVSFRTSAHAGVGISIDFRVSYRHTDRSFAPFSGIRPREMVLLSGRLPRQFENWLAMTGNSPARQIPI
ncbi:MAG: hypothetical protein SPG79_09070, partial [Candidatus Faecousia sp.]|nr:hypothetical protein [Candidatus Faecousia sp.]